MRDTSYDIPIGACRAAIEKADKALKEALTIEAVEEAMFQLVSAEMRLSDVQELAQRNRGR